MWEGSRVGGGVQVGREGWAGVFRSCDSRGRKLSGTPQYFVIDSTH